MNTILELLRKEFLQIFRHRVMLVLLFLMPVIQLVILANAADYEVKHIRLAYLDNDRSAASLRLRSHFEVSPYFVLVDPARGEAACILDRGQADLVLDVPQGFERHLYRGRAQGLHLTADAVNAMKAGVASGYAEAILRHFQIQWLMERSPTPPAAGVGLTITSSNWFNPTMEYDLFMVPGILVLLVTLIGLFLAGMNVVKEKEEGTIEQLNVTPIRKYQFILGKLLPFWIIALVELAIGLLIGRLFFQVPFVGSLWIIFAFSMVYIPVVLGLGLFISTQSNTQQQAMFLAWFFTIVFVLMSGLFTPIESMPGWAQAITAVNPVKYFVEVMRLVLLKGSGWADLRPHFLIVGAMAVLINVVAVWSYRKTAA